MKLVTSIFVFLLSIFFSQHLNAQNTVLSTGRDGHSNTHAISYSIGQVFYQEFRNLNNFIIDGVQQPFEISIESSIFEFENFDFSIKVYPNPALSFLKLDVDFDLYFLLSYQLFDINGKFIEQQNIKNNITLIDVSKLPPAPYFLKILYHNIYVETFKIIKFID